MPSDLEFTGERFVPGIAGEIVYEHAHRYAFARQCVAGRRVLDAACGEGYGSGLLAETAADVIGVDIDPATITHASAAYAGRRTLQFRQGSVTSLPLADASVDVVVSFETIEHLEAHDQPAMLAEFARVLAPGGVLVLSAPNRVEYSEARNIVNPFHRREHDRAELASLISMSFPAQHWYRQRVWLGSLLWSEQGGTAYEALSGDAHAASAAPLPAAMYHVVVAARDAASLPAPGVALSLFSDADESEWKRAQAHAAEVIRLDSLLKERVTHLEQLVAVRERLVQERDEWLAQRAAHIVHLEGLVAYRDKIVAERDATLATRGAQLERLEAVVADRERVAADRDADVESFQHALGEAKRHANEFERECQRLERAVNAQERLIAYRQTARWWFELPWLRLRLLWQRVAGR